SVRASCRARALVVLLLLVAAVLALAPAPAVAAGGGEASLKVPDLGQVSFGGEGGRGLLGAGLFVCGLGLWVGAGGFAQLKGLPVHESMREVSELIYETCKTYLITQGKFLGRLWILIAIIILLYFGWLLHFEAIKVAIILFFSLVGIGGSYGVAWFGM